MVVDWNMMFDPFQPFLLFVVFLFAVLEVVWSFGAGHNSVEHHVGPASAQRRDPNRSCMAVLYLIGH